MWKKKKKKKRPPGPFKSRERCAVCMFYRNEIVSPIVFVNGGEKKKTRNSRIIHEYSRDNPAIYCVARVSTRFQLRRDALQYEWTYEVRQ